VTLMCFPLPKFAGPSVVPASPFTLPDAAMDSMPPHGHPPGYGPPDPRRACSWSLFLSLQKGGYRFLPQYESAGHPVRTPQQARSSQST
jgi:hypothetical protein